MILSIGEILLDIFPSEGKKLGGAPLNCLYQSALLGSKCRFVGSIGEDENGEIIRDEASKLPFAGLNLNVKKGSKTTYSLVELKGGERSFVFSHDGDSDINFNVAEIASLLAKDDISIFHIGSLMLRTEEGYETALRILDLKKDYPRTIFSFDANIREDLFDGDPNFLGKFRTLFAKVDLLKLSMDELCLFSKEGDFKTKVDSLNLKDGTILLVTDGSRGSYCVKNDINIHLPAVALYPIDTTGAGDAFLGGFLYKLDKNRRVDKETLIQALKIADACGAYATQKVGIIGAYADRKTLKAFDEERKGR